MDKTVVVPMLLVVVEDRLGVDFASAWYPDSPEVREEYENHTFTALFPRFYERNVIIRSIKTSDGKWSITAEGTYPEMVKLHTMLGWWWNADEDRWFTQEEIDVYFSNYNR